MIVEFPARQKKWHMMFDLLRIIEYTAGFTKTLSGGDRFNHSVQNSPVLGGAS